MMIALIRPTLLSIQSSHHPHLSLHEKYKFVLNQQILKGGWGLWFQILVGKIIGQIEPTFIFQTCYQICQSTLYWCTANVKIASFLH